MIQENLCLTFPACKIISNKYQLLFFTIPSPKFIDARKTTIYRGMNDFESPYAVVEKLNFKIGEGIVINGTI